MNKARQELRAMAHRFDEHLGEVQSDYEKVIREIKSEAMRYRAIEDGLAASGYPLH
jgi:hypothetical protein